MWLKQDEMAYAVKISANTAGSAPENVEAGPESGVKQSPATSEADLPQIEEDGPSLEEHPVELEDDDFDDMDAELKEFMADEGDTDSETSSVKR